MMSEAHYKHLIEAALFSSQEPLDLDKIKRLIDDEAIDAKALITTLQEEYQERGVELVKVASGYRFQAKQAYAAGLRQLYEKNPPRYSRALLETLVLIAYRQPITRGEIEEIRGVAVNANIMKLLQERDWIKVVGQKDVPGKPALFATTKAFLDYFNLKSLSDLPPLDELMDLEKAERDLAEQLSLAMPGPAELPDEPSTQAAEAFVEVEDEQRAEHVEAPVEMNSEPAAEL